MFVVVAAWDCMGVILFRSLFSSQNTVVVIMIGVGGSRDGSSELPAVLIGAAEWWSKVSDYLSRIKSSRRSMRRSMDGPRLCLMCDYVMTFCSCTILLAGISQLSGPVHVCEG